MFFNFVLFIDDMIFIAQEIENKPKNIVVFYI